MRIPAKVLLCFLIACVATWAQSTAQINGNVRDASGSSVPDATVVATQTATGATRTTVSGPDGAFVLPNLAIGPYTLEITKASFAKYVQTGIVLEVDSNPTIDASLKVGAVNDTVTVEADAGMVETHSTGVGTVIDNARVVELPLNGRDATQLIFLSGMATPGTVPQLRNFPATSVSVAGGQGNGVSYQLDGSQMNDVASSLNLPLPFPDALQEFKVETSALPAQYGFHSAATVNAVTKAGTNGFHGDAFDFIRNGDFNARDYFALQRDSLKQNQWGGTIGGPILKNKLFFFAGWQQRETRSNPPSTIAFVPTAAELTGDFSVVESAACNNGTAKTLKSIAGVTVTGNNQIPASVIAANTVGLKIVSLLPTSPDPCGKVTYGLVTNANQYDSVSRVDYQINAKQSFFGRATTNVLNLPTTFDGKSPLTLNTNATANKVYTLAVGHTYLLASNVINSFHAAVSRTGIARTPDPFPYDWKDLGANFTDVGSGKTVRFTVANGFTIGGVNGNPGNTATGPNPQFGDDLSIVKGSHQLQFGGSYIFQLMNYWSGLNATGSGTFAGGTSGTGLAMADFLTGAGNGAYGWVQGNIYGFTLRQNYLGLYAQDSWKLAHNLTVSYGLRYEPYLAVYSKYGQFMHFDQNQFNAGVKSQTFVNAPPGLTFPGDPSYTPGRSVENDKWSKFAPRLGLVWDPKGDGKMTVRAAYGIFNDRESAFSLNFIAQDAPFGGSITANNPTLANPWVAQAGGNPFPIAVNKDYKFGQNGNVVTHPLDQQPTYLQQWNLSLQRQIGTSWLLTANYLGNHTTHLLSSVQMNYGVNLGQGPCNLNQVVGGVVTSVPQAVCTTAANLTLRRVEYLQNPLQGQFYSGIAAVDDGATASYNALFLSAQKRLGQGFSVQGNYTWSHCIGDIFDTQTGAAGAAVAGIPGNREALRSNCGTSDIRHLFNLSMVARTPNFSNKLLRMVATGWQISPIVRIQSAKEFTVTAGVDTALSGVAAAGETANLANPAGIYPANQSYSNWLSKAAFSTPANGTYGNLGLNNIKGPGNFNVDMSLVRIFQVRERISLQIRAEAFNLPNWVNFSNPTSALNSNLFGTITSDDAPRIVQLAAKIMF
jgi:hypothetical protein